jgi:hypothetical protein
LKWSRVSSEVKERGEESDESQHVIGQESRLGGRDGKIEL